MKKTIKFTSLLLILILVFAMSSCNKNSTKESETETIPVKEALTANKDNAEEEWLKSIFQCENGNGYCLPDDEKVFTKRYKEFFQETLEIFEYPEFETEKERISAEAAYRKKWK